MQTMVDSDELNLQRIQKHQSVPSETVGLSYKMQINSRSGEDAESVTQPK